MSCRQDDCSQDEQTRGYCETHYRYRLHTGRYGYRDAAPIRAHLDELRAAGWTWEQIGQAAGLSTWVAHNVWRGVSRRVLAESADKLLALTVVERESHRGVSNLGTRRRIQALMWMGWPATEIGPRVCYKPCTIYNASLRGGISVRLAGRIAALYGELSAVEGPSKVASTKARRRGYAPPAAWDDDTIDDPRARPCGVRRAA